MLLNNTSRLIMPFLIVYMAIVKNPKEQTHAHMSSLGKCTKYLYTDVKPLQVDQTLDLPKKRLSTSILYMAKGDG